MITINKIDWNEEDLGSAIPVCEVHNCTKQLPEFIIHGLSSDIEICKSHLLELGFIIGVTEK